MEIAVLTCQRVCFFQGRATRSRRGDFLLARDIQSSNPTKYMYRQWRKKSSSRKEIKGRPFNISNEFISSRVLTPSDPILRSHFALKVAKHFKKQHELTDVPFLAILVFSHPHEQQDYRTRGELHIMQTLQYPGNLKAICATPAASGFAIL